MNYFNFTEFDDRVFIPINRSTKQRKRKSSFVDHTTMKNTKGLNTYIYITSINNLLKKINDIKTESDFNQFIHEQNDTMIYLRNYEIDYSFLLNLNFKHIHEIVAFILLFFNNSDDVKSNIVSLEHLKESEYKFFYQFYSFFSDFDFSKENKDCRVEFFNWLGTQN